MAQLFLEKVNPTMSVKLLKSAYDKLSPSNLESGLPGRETQCDELFNFLHERLKVRTKTAATKRAKVEAGHIANIKSTHLNKTIFICGVPGTGKTATVRLVVDKLEAILKQRSSDIKPFEFIYINGQQLAKPERIYSEILHKLTDENTNPERAQDILESIFIKDDADKESLGDTQDESIRQSRSKKNTVKKTNSKRTETSKKTRVASDVFKIIAVDELDLLYNERRQSVFYSLFDWPTHSNSKMILIAIANAMDLPERFMRGRIASRVGWNKIVFESYTSDCLEKILRVRLGTELLNQTFEKASVIIATKRIGRTSGDARRILDTCRLAIEKAIESDKPKVTPAIIDQVGFQNVDIGRSNYIRDCSPIQLLILKSIMIEIDKVGEERVETYSVYKQLMNLLGKIKYFKDSRIGPDCYSLHLNALAGADIIILERDKPLFERRICIKDSSVAFRDLIRVEQPKVYD